MVGPRWVMRIVRLVWNELVSLFFDDRLTIPLLALIAVVTAAATLFPVPPLAGAGVLLVACIVLLAWSLI
jgi:hypothetical protein